MADHNNKSEGRQEVPGISLHRMDSLKARDLHGLDNSIPLSPQWLLPKPGENKPGATSGDPPVISSPNYGSRGDFLTKVASGNGEELFDTEKKKDAWRLSSVEAESVRRERWRDEEREGNSTVRRDRWREGDKDLVDHRRVERWGDNPSGRNPVEIRRLPSERRHDSGNREASYDARRESKWNTRWGPEDKDIENRRDKWLESSKDGEGQREKNLTALVDSNKDSERENEHNPRDRPWRSNSLQSRVRGEASYQSTIAPGKQAPGFGFGRGRSDVGSPGFTAGRGRGNYTGSSSILSSSTYSPLGASSERWDTNPSNGAALKYTRAKLLDIYRKCGMKPSFARLPDGFTEVPLLTQAESLEPLALSVPSHEEEAILEGIEKGDIVSSGAPQFSKDGALGRNRDDVVRSRRQRTGSREDGTSTIDGHREESLNDSKADYSHYQQSQAAEKQKEFLCADFRIGGSREQQALRESVVDIEGSKSDDFRRKHREESAKFVRDVNLNEDSSAHMDGSWRSQAVGDELQGPLHDWRDFKSELISQRSDARDVGWSRSMGSKDQSTEHERNALGTMISRENETDWHFQEPFLSNPSRNTDLKRQTSEILDKKLEGSRTLVMEDASVERENGVSREGHRHVPPEELSLIYRDPQGDVQGPFSGADMIGWFEAGYFGLDLPVRLANASVGSPFSLLGDVMPHLRMKARAPPGFGMPKQGDVTDVTNRGKFGSHGKAQANTIGSGFELAKNGEEDKRNLTAEAENSFVESFIMGNKSQPVETFDPVEGGPHGFHGLSPGGMQSMGVDSVLDVNYAMGRRMSPYPSVERQSSLPNLFPYLWSARDTSPLVTSSEIVTDSIKSSSSLSSMTSDAHSISHANQHGDIISLIQGTVDGSGVSPMNKVVRPWSSYPDVQSRGSLGHAGMDIPHQEQLDMHHLQRFSPVQTGFPFQHQRQQQQQQHQPLASHLIPPSLENLSGGMSLEQLLPSALHQEPQTLSLFQQQQQQQLLLSQLQLRSQVSMPSQVSLLDQFLLLQQQKQQQQQLLPQVLLEQRSHQHLQEPSYERVQASGTLGNTSADHLLFRQPHDAFVMNAQLPQHVPSPQVATIDNLLHLKNQQTPKGSNLSQQIQLDDNLKLGQMTMSVPQQSSVGETQLSNVWEANESDQLATVSASAFSSSFELIDKASREQMPHQLGHTACDASVSNAESQIIQDSPIVIQSEEILAGAMPSTKMNDLALPEKHMITTGLLTRAVSDSPIDHPPLQTSLEEYMNTSDLRTSTVLLAEDLKAQDKQANNDVSPAREVNAVETREVKKGSEKRSRKQKNSKMSSERQKGQSEVTNGQQVKLEASSFKEVTFPVEKPKEMEYMKILNDEDGSTMTLPQVQVLCMSSSQNLHLPVPTGISGESLLSTEVKTASSDVESVSRSSVAASLSHRAWKPAPCPKPKSLLEIQEEEQRQKAETEKVGSDVAILAMSASVPSIGLTPWAGSMIGSEIKSSREVQQDVNVASVLNSDSGNLDSSSGSRTKRSHLHDLLAEEVLAKTSQKTLETPTTASVEKSPATFTSPLASSPVEVTAGNDNEFVEAKEAKKSRKRGLKGKGAAGKTTTVVSLEPVVASVPTEKSKSSRQVQQEKEVLPVPPAGPSLGDFLVWKGEYSSSPPTPAWSVDMGKQTKAASLREIQREQERKTSSSLQQQSLVSAVPKVHTSRSLSGSSSTWQHLAFPPSPKSGASTQSNVLPSSYSRSKTEDELFWGPVNQSKQDSEQPEFPSLIPNKNSTLKGNTGKSASGLSSMPQLSASSVVANMSHDFPSSSSKGKKQLASKHSEARDFRDWCETELYRLIGNNDTHFLEFCLKQSTSEAEMLLIENLGTFDPEREFIDKVLKYKELLPTEVIEIAFSHCDVQMHVGTNLQSERVNTIGVHSRRPAFESKPGRESDDLTLGNDLDASGKGGKKKGKKGKKVNPSVLGFNVVSTTRIMKGEIQHIED